MEEPRAEELQRRWVVEAAAREIRDAKSWSRNWSIVAVTTVFVIAVMFCFVIFVTGLSAIRENTRTVRSLRDISTENRLMLTGFRQDMETNRLMFEVLKRQLTAIESKMPEPPPTRKAR